MPVERLPDNFLDGKSSIWVGPDKHAVVYFLRGGSLLNFVGAVELEERIEESWTQRAALDRVAGRFRGLARRYPDDHRRRRPRRLLPLAAERAPGIWTRGAPRRAVLIGDAAHPMLPYMAQGAAVAVEDGAVLARALDQAGAIPDALALYESHRKPRARRVVDESRDNRRLFHLPDEAALRAAFAERNMDRERSDWLYNYNPLTVDL